MARSASRHIPRAGANAPVRGDAAVRELREAIDALVAERQELRSAGAGRAALEQNRLELARRHRELAFVVIGRHRRASGPGDAQDELQRSVGAGPVLANKLLAA